MNDPHVEALIYQFEHPAHIDFGGAKPVEGARSGFEFRLENDELRISFLDHYSTEEAARGAIEPFLREWELAAELEYPPVRTRFVFRDSEMIDRNPSPGIAARCVSIGGVAIVLATGAASHGHYPSPPTNVARNSDVDKVLKRYQEYRDGRCKLAEIANFCLTAIEAIGGGKRREAATHLKISGKVLGKLAELADGKGGEHARKFKGSYREFTSSEWRWLNNLLPKLIQRAAEYAYDPYLPYARQITMAELPPLNPGNESSRATETS